MNKELFTAHYSALDGLYLKVEGDKNNAFLESLESCEKKKTDLKGFFNRELEIVGKLEGMTVFFIGTENDLFETTYYYEPVLILDENRIFCKYGEHIGRDHNYIGGRWK